MKQTLLKLKFPPCQGCSSTTSPTPSGHGDLWALWQMTSARGSWEPRARPGCSCRQTALTDGQLDLDTPLCLCEQNWKACNACVQLRFPLTSGQWNNPPHIVASSILSCLPCLFCSLLEDSDLSSVSGQCLSLELRREKRQIEVLPSYRWMSAYHNLVAVLFPSPPTPLPLTWCYPCASYSYLWSTINITASQSLALSKVHHCIIHEFGNKRRFFRIPLSLMNFHRWISGLFGWLKLKFELLKQQGGSLELLCQEGWGRQHFIFSLIRTSP